MGSIPPYSAQPTEYLHRPFVKQVYRLHTNKQKDHLHQICRHLDRWEKRRLFAEKQHLEMMSSPDDENQEPSVRYDQKHEGTGPQDAQDPDDPEPQIPPWLSLLLSGEGVPPSRPITNYFKKASEKIKGENTFTNEAKSVAFHLINKPKKMSLVEASKMWQLSDLCPALVDYFGSKETLPSQNSNQSRSKGPNEAVIGGERISKQGNGLRFDQILVWNNVRIQKRSVQLHRRILPSQQLQAYPPGQPSEKWQYGRYDTCIVSNKSTTDFQGFISFSTGGKWSLICH
jgi:hypothetical protein